jgi:hypothetical protein
MCVSLKIRLGCRSLDRETLEITGKPGVWKHCLSILQEHLNPYIRRFWVVPAREMGND